MSDYGRWAYKVEEAAQAGRGRRAAGARCGAPWAMAGTRCRPPGAARNSNCRRRRQRRPRRHRGLDSAGLRRGPCSPRRASTSTRRRPPRPTRASKRCRMGLHGRRARFTTRFGNSIRQMSSRCCRDAAAHENVLYTAHWDSLGADRARRPRHFQRRRRQRHAASPVCWCWRNPSSRTKPVADRSIVFLATTAAEPDLLGSEYYVANPIFPLRRNRGRDQCRDT